MKLIAIRSRTGPITKIRLYSYSKLHFTLSFTLTSMLYKFPQMKCIKNYTNLDNEVMPSLTFILARTL